MDDKITIAWDIDDVLNDLMNCWLELKWKAEHNNCRLTYQDIIENPPNRILGVSLENYLQSLDDFRLSRMYLEMTPPGELLNWFQAYGSRFRHIAVTSAPILAAHQSASWVMKNYAMWIRTFHLVPSRRIGVEDIVYDRTKADTLAWFNNRDVKVHVFIDDNSVNVEQAEKLGIKSYLVSRPWNQSKVSLAEVLSDIARRL